MLKHTDKFLEWVLSISDGWKVVDVLTIQDPPTITVQIAHDKGGLLPCPESGCGELCTVRDHRAEREWRHLKICEYQTFIRCKMPRIQCSKHGLQTAEAPWAEPYSRFTTKFEAEAISVMLVAKSLTDACKKLEISWDQAHAIRLAATRRGLERRNTEPVTYIGIDEKSFGKGHKYVTLMTNIDNGSVMDVEQQRTQEAAVKLLESLTLSQREGVEAVSIDMWVPFSNAVEQVLPHADIVHDKFHAVAYISKALDAVRKKEHSHYKKLGNGILTGTKYLFLKNKTNWSKEEKREFKALRVMNLKVGRAWSIRESFKPFWEYKTKKGAERFFDKWHYWATHSRLDPIRAAAKTLKRHLDRLLTYMDHRITNAVTEGLNSKIQILKANARGFRNFENYRIAILFYCGKMEMMP